MRVFLSAPRTAPRSEPGACEAAEAAAEVLRCEPNAAKLISGCCAGETKLLIDASGTFSPQALLVHAKSNVDFYLSPPVNTAV